MTLNSDSSWQEMAIALARKMTVISHCYPTLQLDKSKIEEAVLQGVILPEDEALEEAIYLTDQVWAKQAKELDSSAPAPLLLAS
jgi:hypothetical protein